MAGTGIEPRTDGYVQLKSTGLAGLFIWTPSENLPKPEDFVLARSRTTLADIYHAGEREGPAPAMPPPMVLDGGQAQRLSNLQLAGRFCNVPVGLAGGTVLTSLLPERALALNRHQRKAPVARLCHAPKHAST